MPIAASGQETRPCFNCFLAHTMPSEKPPKLQSQRHRNAIQQHKTLSPKESASPDKVLGQDNHITSLAANCCQFTSYFVFFLNGLPMFLYLSVMDNTTSL